LSLRIVQPKVGSYPKCFESCRISSKSDTSRRLLRRLITTNVALFRGDRKGSVSEICFRRTWHVRFGKHVGRATYKPPYPNNEDLQVWKGVLNTSDLDDVLLIRNVKIDAERKLDETSLRLAAQLPISHEKLDIIEDEIDMASLTPNLFLSSRENPCFCVACSHLLSRDYIVAQNTSGASDSHFPIGKRFAVSGISLTCNE
jgi:hypothetical protein